MEAAGCWEQLSKDRTGDDGHDMASEMLAKFATMQVNALPRQEHVRGIILREPFLGQEEDSTSCSLCFTTADVVVVDVVVSDKESEESTIRFVTLLEAAVLSSKQVEVPDPDTAQVNDQLYYDQSKRFVLGKPQWACWLASGSELGVSEEEEE